MTEQGRVLDHGELSSAGESITVDLPLSGVDGLAGDESIDELARRILGVVVDSFEISDGSFLLSKSATPTATTT